jgi:hypothetical protein
VPRGNKVLLFFHLGESRRSKRDKKIKDAGTKAE